MAISFNLSLPQLANLGHIFVTRTSIMLPLCCLSVKNPVGASDAGDAMSDVRSDDCLSVSKIVIIILTGPDQDDPSTIFCCNKSLA